MGTNAYTPPQGRNHQTNNPLEDEARSQLEEVNLNFEVSRGDPIHADTHPQLQDTEVLLNQEAIEYAERQKRYAEAVERDAQFMVFARGETIIDGKVPVADSHTYGLNA